MPDLEDYLNLPYTVVLRRDEEGKYVARIDKLAGLSTHGRTPQEALGNLEEAKKAWIADCLERGDPVPAPQAPKVPQVPNVPQVNKDLSEEPLPSGKWLQRVPRTLHRDLIRLAKRETVSLNQLVTSLLSEAVGARKPKSVAPAAARPGGMLTPAARSKNRKVPTS